VQQLAQHAGARMLVDLASSAGAQSTLQPASSSRQIASPQVLVTESIDECDRWIVEHVLSRGVLAVGLDTESRPSRGPWEKNKLALVQIATRSAVLLFRVLELAHDELPRLLHYLLRSPVITKYSVGPENELAKRFDDCALLKHVDVQQEAKRRNLGWSQLPGLEMIATRYVPALSFVKNKDLQCSDWGVWPLSQEQCAYAANDALAALAIARKLFSEEQSDDGIVLVRSQPAVSSAAAGSSSGASGSSGSSHPHELSFRRPFNELQQEAIRSIVHGAYHPSPFVLFGPPGTGQ